jgi:N-acyl-D-aspartate/D-glutamate deacylase
MVLYNCHALPELSGKSLDELAQEWNCDPWDVVFDVLLAEIDNFHALLVLAFVYQEQDIHVAYDHPACMVGSDATTMGTDLHLRGCMSHGAFSWACWFYRHFVRDTHRITPQEAVRRLTSLPASRLGLRDRGVLRPKAFAGIAVFDPIEFGERATTWEPQQIAAGMKHVLVNGRFAVEDGRLTSVRAGKVLRRSA